MISIDGLKKNEDSIVDIVHPLSWEGKMKLIESPDRNYCMRSFRRFIKNKFRAWQYFKPVWFAEIEYMPVCYC